MQVYVLLSMLFVASLDARVLDGSTKSKSSGDPGESNSVYESASYNEWVKELFDFFADRDDIDMHDEEQLLRDASAHLLHGAVSNAVNSALIEAQKHQCPSTMWTIDSKKFMKKIQQKDTCIIRVGEKLSSEYRNMYHYGFTVRDHVGSKLICRTVPEVFSCFEPILEDLLDCTDDLPVGMDIILELKNKLIKTYCINEATNLAGILGKAPQKCLRAGGENFVNFIGPSFIRKVPVADSSEFPCAVSRYIGNMASVLLPMSCHGHTLSKIINFYTTKFNEELGCPEVFLG